MRRAFSEIVNILILAALLGWLQYGLVAAPEDIPVVIPAGQVSLKLVESWGNKVLWLDARRTARYDEEHVPSALPLNKYDWDQQIDVVLKARPQKEKVVVYCYNADCPAAEKIADRLINEVKMKDVVVLYDGWNAWKKAHP